VPEAGVLPAAHFFLILSANPPQYPVMKKNFTLLLLFVIHGFSFQAQTSKRAGAQQHFVLPANIRMDEFIPNTLVFKVKDQYRGLCSRTAFGNPVFEQLMKAVGGTALERVFPFSPRPEQMLNANGQRLVDLSLTYSCKYVSGSGLIQVINLFLQSGLFDYVEPKPLPRLAVTPNDPYAGSGQQYNIYKINAAGSGTSGWDISTGDTNVVVGITDTGTEPGHPDLNGNIKRNMGEIPNNGIDDDHDGYIDNYLGWDLGQSDNDPTYPGPGNEHGVHVSGIVAAIVNNNTGVAGVGYKCKFLPVKIADGSGSLSKSYEGIVYAADHGVKVINCSWGGPFGGSYGQSVIDYATINKDVLVVAACGNNSADQDFYPSSYDGVLSVAATTSTDQLASFSNYCYAVGVSAPGDAIYSTYSLAGGSYQYLSGTSMASPCVAGLCAVVRSKYPGYDAYQTAARVKQTASKNLYSYNSGQSYAGKLGTGRVDMYAALTAAAMPWVLDTARHISDHHNEIFGLGDTLRIGATYVNLLAPTKNLTATLSSSSPYVSIFNPVLSLGVLTTRGAANNYAVPYLVKLIGAPPLNQQVVFTITYADSGYTSSHSFAVLINVDYLNININDVATTVTSKSLNGYNDNPAQTQGLGFNYKNKGSLLYEGGLMVGVSGTQVSDNVRGASSPKTSFVDIQRVRQILPPVVSNFDAIGIYSDSGAPAATALHIDVLQKDYAWTSAGNTKFVILQYYIRNTGSSTLTNLYAGIFADYDITASTASSNKDAFDAANRMGYAWYTGTNGLYGGTKLLSHTAPVIHYGIDNVSGGAGGVNIYSGFTDVDKYTTLSTNRAAAGNTAPAGNDVLDVTSSGPFTIAPGDSIEVAFALIAGDSLSDLKNSAIHAQILYDGLLAGIYEKKQTEFAYLHAFPNPSSGLTQVELTITAESAAELALYDMQGKKVMLLHKGLLHSGTHRFDFSASNLPAGMYLLRFSSGNSSVNRKISVIK
jgi:serine protease